MEVRVLSTAPNFEKIDVGDWPAPERFSGDFVFRAKREKDNAETRRALRSAEGLGGLAACGGWGGWGKHPCLRKG
jgi:hypothetical protein